MNLTDNEIIKALECCVRSTSGNDCEKLNCPACKDFGCHYMDNSDRDDSYEALVEGLGKDALDFINRQKVEIERFENITATINKFWDILLRYKVAKRKESPTLEEFAEAIQEIQDEAIKEFAERLKEKSQRYPYYEYGLISAVPTEDIDNLVKEMVGD